MTVATSPPPATAWEQAAKASTSPPPHARDSCPLCGATLHPEQEWCLRCGAAARTRLAAAPNWRAPVAVLAVVIVLSLGVLAAAFVKLAGSGSVATTTTTVTTPPAAAAPGTTGAAPGTTLPGSSSPGSTTPGTASPGGASPGAGAAGAGAPGASSTPAPSSTSTSPARSAAPNTAGVTPSLEARLRRLRGAQGK